MRAGIDIGGTKTQAVVVDAAGQLMQQLRLRTGFGAQAVLASAFEAVTRVATLAGTTVAELQSIGVGIPGAVNNGSGRVRHAVNLGIDDLAFGSELSSRLGVPVRVENDVNAAAFGSFHRLGSDPTSSMAYLNLGTGLAAGLVLNGELWRGSRGAAGEIGHIPIDPNGPVCTCGQRGCLETVASGSAIARAWPTTNRSPVHDLFSAAAGDGKAVDVKRTVVGNVASAVRILVLTVDVDIVVIGGGISSLGDILLDEIRTELQASAVQSPFLASLELADRVRIVPSDFPAAAVGAALVGTVLSEVA